jgi:hypothetical protein
MQFLRGTAVLFILLILVSCAPAAVPAEKDVPELLVLDSTSAAATAESAVATVVAGTLAAQPTDTPQPTPTFTPVPTFTPTADPPVPVSTHYTLDVDFSYAGRRGEVAQQIIYTNNTGEILTELPLVVALFEYPDAFSLTGLWWLDGPLDGQPVERSTRKQQQILISLPEPLKAGQRIGLRLSYEFALPAQASLGGERPLPIGHTIRQANLVDWYPFVPPYRSGLGWLAHPPSYYGEHLVSELADFVVNLRLLDKRGDLVVAASALPDPHSDGLTFHRTGARSFAISIGHEYYSETAQVGEVTVTSYYFIFHEKAGKRALQTTVEALELYQELFGPYPHDSLSVVEADFFDGMEYDGLYFLSRAFYNLHQGRPDDYLVAIAAHETAHMWWYALIGNDQANEPWLDEALCTYSERLYYERYYPEALHWWWNYRIKYDKPDGWVDSTVYSPPGSVQTYQDYRNAVYLNGALFFEDLRDAVGDEVFFAFLRDYADHYAGKIAFSTDFFDLLAQHTDVDLDPLLSKYFANRQP